MIAESASCRRTDGRPPARGGSRVVGGTVAGGVLVYRDGDHLTATFVETLIPMLDAQLSRVVADRLD